MKLKHLMSFFILAVVTAVTLASCGPKCKNCHAEIMEGVATPAQELCGEQLKQALKTPGMKCE